MENNGELNIFNVSKAIKEGIFLPFGVKKDMDGKENLVLLLKESNKKYKTIEKEIKNAKMYRVVLPIKKKEKYITVALFLLSINEELKYLTYLVSDGMNDMFFEKSLLLDRITVVVANSDNLMKPYLMGGIPYDKEIKKSETKVEKEDIMKIGTLLNVIGASKMEEFIDDIYNGNNPFGEKELSLDFLEMK